jgi:GMP synthase (glutamine-hydrolysing)
MHYYEFVKPIEDIVKKTHMDFTSVHYNNLNKKIIDSVSKIIICGTSLRDFTYMKDMEKFSFLKNIKKPVLGICGGMQLMCKAFGCSLTKETQIGLSRTIFNGFLGLDGARDVYELHNMIVKDDFVLKKNFDILARNEKNKSVQAVKHTSLPVYGTLFHPEVRNKDVIERFVRL